MELKFRAYDLIDGKMYYDVGLSLIGVHVYKSPARKYPIEEILLDRGKDCFKVMQFTGLYDGTKWSDLRDRGRNYITEYAYEKADSINTPLCEEPTEEEAEKYWKGREIYCRDLISIPSNLVYQPPTVAKDNIYCVIWKNERAGFALRNGAEPDLTICAGIDKCRIIGNSYENPEISTVLFDNFFT